jgi:hypothetical protein
MPGYGVQPPDGGTGLLPWTWAQERLVSSRDFWLDTADFTGSLTRWILGWQTPAMRSPDGRPETALP